MVKEFMARFYVTSSNFYRETMRGLTYTDGTELKFYLSNGMARTFESSPCARKSSVFFFFMCFALCDFGVIRSIYCPAREIMSINHPSVLVSIYLLYVFVYVYIHIYQSRNEMKEKIALGISSYMVSVINSTERHSYRVHHDNSITPDEHNYLRKPKFRATV